MPGMYMFSQLPLQRAGTQQAFMREMERVAPNSGIASHGDGLSGGIIYSRDTDHEMTPTLAKSLSDRYNIPFAYAPEGMPSRQKSQLQQGFQDTMRAVDYQA